MTRTGAGHPAHVVADSGAAQTDGPHASDSLVVPSLPASIASVRRFAVQACRQSGMGFLCDTVALLVSEVATNALVHGTGDVQVRVITEDSMLRVEVSDDSPTMPTPRTADPMEEGGRGLALVASLASDWGVHRAGVGKVVWFELAA